MEYVQQVLVHVAAARLGDARALFDDLEAHRRELRGLRGFVSMSVSRSSEPGGDTLVSVESRWKDEAALTAYLASPRHAASIINSHAAITVPDTLQTRRLEAMDIAGPAKSAIVTERFLTALAVPMIIFAAGLAVIYALSRVFLETGSNGAVTIAIIISGGILLAAWYFAQNRAASLAQMGGIAAVAVAALIGGTVWAQTSEGPHIERDEILHGGGEEIPGAEETPSAAPGTPGNVIELDDNVFVYNGQENPTVPAAAGQDVTFDLDNVGNALHNVHVAASGGYGAAFCRADGDDPCSDPVRINGGDDGSITFNLPPGTYDFRCDFHAVEMVGKLQIQ